MENKIKKAKSTKDFSVANVGYTVSVLHNNDYSYVITVMDDNPKVQ